MHLDLNNRQFIVCGATSGFGLAITKKLVAEGAKVIAVARNVEKLEKLSHDFFGSVEIFAGDITRYEVVHSLFKIIEKRKLDGILVNAGGPPAKSFEETRLEDWDQAYQQILRWKVDLTKTFLPRMLEQNYGRFLFIESAAVKQPLENLILSTSLRLSVVGFVKTLSQEMPDKGITFNILAPGYHYTPAVERLVQKKSENEKISFEEAKKNLEHSMPMKKTGNVNDFASLRCGFFRRNRDI